MPACMDTPTILSRDTIMDEDENKRIALSLEGEDHDLLSTTSFLSRASEHEENVFKPIGVENGEGDLVDPALTGEAAIEDRDILEDKENMDSQSMNGAVLKEDVQT